MKSHSRMWIDHKTCTQLIKWNTNAIGWKIVFIIKRRIYACVSDLLKLMRDWSVTLKGEEVKTWRKKYYLKIAVYFCVLIALAFRLFSWKCERKSLVWTRSRTKCWTWQTNQTEIYYRMHRIFSKHHSNGLYRTVQTISFGQFQYWCATSSNRMQNSETGFL